MLMRAKRSFPSLKSVDAGFMPSTKRPSYVAITSDLLRAPSTVSVAPEHFVSSTVVKVSIRVLKINRVRFAGAVTNARFAPLDGLPVVPVPLSTTPVLLHKPRARHEWAFAGMPRVRQASVCGSAAGRCAPSCDSLGASLRPPLHFPRSPTADRSLNGFFRAPFDAVRLAAPAILACARLPQPAQILWAAQ